jgi:hypothetical protein
VNLSVITKPEPERLTFTGPSGFRGAEPVPENVAVTVFAAFIVTVQVVFVPAQAPPQLSNFPPVPALARRTTLVFAASFSVHMVAPLPQLIPPPVTTPRPVTETESGNVPGAPPVKVAVTLLALVMETTQVGEVPLQAPPQPVKVAPAAGVADKVTFEFEASSALHVGAPLPQLIPAPVTVPLPLTETVSVTGALENVALTLLDALITTVQVVAVPPHAPLQPMKVAPSAGATVKVTDWLRMKVAEQEVPLLPQLIAPLPPLTLPLPVTETVSFGAAANVAPTVLAASIVTEHAGTLPEQAPVQPVKA